MGQCEHADIRILELLLRLGVVSVHHVGEGIQVWNGLGTEDHPVDGVAFGFSNLDAAEDVVLEVGLAGIVQGAIVADEQLSRRLDRLRETVQVAVHAADPTEFYCVRT